MGVLMLCERCQAEIKESAGMDRHELRAALLQRAGRLKDVANEMDVTQKTLSQVINYRRENAPLRKQLEDTYGVRFIDKGQAVKGMSSHEIRRVLIDTEGQIGKAAKRLRVPATTLSRVINYYRTGYAVREKIEKTYPVRFIPVSELKPRESSTAATPVGDDRRSIWGS
jgi:transcriptional regulator with PAS, ATPase and Fis domain